MGSRDVRLAIRAKPRQIGFTGDMHENVEMFAAFRFTNEDGVEGLVGRVTA